MQATAQAHPNIAFIKYWGNSDETLRIPVNSSLSMNLDGILTQTTVRLDGQLSSDMLELNDEKVTGAALERVSEHLDILRKLADSTLCAEVRSSNNFPTGAGIASSASAFAALTVAGAAAFGLELSERQLSTIARRGSGSASRSVPSGFVEWHMGDSDATSYAESIADVDHWNLIDVIAVISHSHKAVGSKRGHQSANTSDLQAARVAGADERLKQCKTAVLGRDFMSFAEVVEHDSNLMHAVMMTSKPPLFYWLPPTLTIMDSVRRWRSDGLNVCYTLDAGPNVHCLCLSEDADEIERRLREINGIVDVLVAKPGKAAKLMSVEA